MKPILFLLFALCAFGQKAPWQNPNYTALDNTGAICVGCKLYTYAAGGTTPQATYTDAAGGSSNTNPVIMDSAGRANIWLGAAAYRFDLYTSANVLIWSVDNVLAPAINTASTCTANTVYAGPSSGSPAVPSCRALVANDIPSLNASKITAGQLIVAQGGTGAATLTGVIIGNGTSAMTAVATPGTTTTFLNGNQAFSTPALANLTAGALPTNTTLTAVFPYDFNTGACDNVTGVINVSHPSSNPSVTTCVTGSNTNFGVELFSATTQTFQIRMVLPDDWVSGSGNDIVLYFYDVTDTNTGHNEVFSVSTACTAAAASLDPSFNTAQKPTAAVSSGAASSLNTMTQSTFTTTGCSAGRVLFLKIGLDATRTATGNAAIVSVRVKLKRTITAL